MNWEGVQPPNPPTIPTLSLTSSVKILEATDDRGFVKCLAKHCTVYTKHHSYSEPQWAFIV